MATPEKPCVCGTYEVLIPQHTNDHGDAIWSRESTDCSGTTKSTYTPGQDAVLKKLLVGAGVDDHPVRWSDGETVIAKAAERWAADLGWADAVRAEIERKRARCRTHTPRTPFSWVSGAFSCAGRMPGRGVRGARRPRQRPRRGSIQPVRIQTRRKRRSGRGSGCTGTPPRTGRGGSW